jgi:hypothetical protein
MTIEDLFGFLDSNPLILALYFAVIPLIAILLPLFHGKANAVKDPYRYIYSVLMYLSSVPGLSILFILVYLVLFQNANILKLSLVSFFLPVVSMLVTLLTIRNSLKFSEIPGISRLSGLFGLIISTFLIIFFLDRLRIYVFFRGHVLIFVLLFAGLFLFLKYSIRLLWGKRGK